jgi:hypothetical protein
VVAAAALAILLQGRAGAAWLIFAGAVIGLGRLALGLA